MAGEGDDEVVMAASFTATTELTMFGPLAMASQATLTEAATTWPRNRRVKTRACQTLNRSEKCTRGNR